MVGLIPVYMMHFFVMGSFHVTMNKILTVFIIKIPQSQINKLSTLLLAYHIGLFG